MTEEVNKAKVLEDMIKILDIMVKERTYQYRLEIDTLQMKLANEEKANFILHSDRNEVFKLWDMHKYRLEIAKEALAFYANKHNYEDHDFKGGMGHTMTFKPILDDGFDIAIKTLERINEE